MTITETRSQTAFDDRKYPRLVSFENSNSWIKRHDSDGTLIVQSGYRENPGKVFDKDNQNPVIAIDGRAPRWYGSKACDGRHTAIHGRSKVETARDSFAACLQVGDDGRDLIVVASHWDDDDFPALKKVLLGNYSVVRNGHDIKCQVTQVITTLEGIGSYHSVSHRLKSGKTLLIELGFGTAEIWVIGADGKVSNGAPVDSLGVFNLANAIAAEPVIRNLLQDSSGNVNRSLVSAALKEPTLGKLSESQWQAIKAKHSNEYLKQLQAFIKTNYAEQSQSLSNIVLTGGGAALLRSIQPKVDQVFIIPEKPQTASVTGSYAHQMSLIGG